MTAPVAFSEAVCFLIQGLALIPLAVVVGVLVAALAAETGGDE